MKYIVSVDYKDFEFTHAEKAIEFAETAICTVTNEYANVEIKLIREKDEHKDVF